MTFSFLFSKTVMMSAKQVEFFMFRVKNCYINLSPKPKYGEGEGNWGGG